MTPPTPDDTGLRLAKRLMELHGCSRSQAEQFIEGGWVRVDGVVVETPGARVQPHQQVTLAQDATLLDLRPVTLLVHQSAGAPRSRPPLPQAHTHWDQDTTMPRVLQRHLRQLHCAAPLPPQASGLVVYTQEPRIARKLHEDMAELEHECVAEVTPLSADASGQALQALRHGLLYQGHRAPPIKASWQSEQRLRLAFKGLDLHDLATLCAAVGLPLNTLHRIRLGRIPLARLPAGQWRYLGAADRF